ncbi:hypothetical protein AMJ40_05425 [candidate division TA06 bacterium DG_26]|uniref:Response regulatory domain-containing protein n=1 Tax=candidate division TA06 bacterium DG_26 TaxID=1703771 RepID=A0A0S7WH58_UNCT6|nr:MAG: hypothetical protein AMJ40_05425 [candidate division TA06 bacterium DG_26]
MACELNVLLVDDEPSWLESLSAVLGRCGVSVKMVQSAVEALRAFREEIFELIITDFEMPGMNGLELARELRSLCCTAPIILMTGDKDIRSSRSVTGAGITACIDKSENLDEMLRSIERLSRKPIALRRRVKT